MKLLLHIAEALGLMMVVISVFVIWDWPVWKVGDLVGYWRMRKSQR
jgi:hypothetical protein